MVLTLNDRRHIEAYTNTNLTTWEQYGGVSKVVALVILALVLTSDLCLRRFPRINSSIVVPHSAVFWWCFNRYAVISLFVSFLFDRCIYRLMDSEYYSHLVVTLEVASPTSIIG